VDQQLEHLTVTSSAANPPLADAANAVDVTGALRVSDVLSDPDLCHGLKHLKRLLPLFGRLHEVGCQRDKASNRCLHFDGYCALVLLYMFNPLIGSLRTLQKASALPAVARALGVKRFSLGSFSEAPSIFDPQLLQEVIAELAAQARPLARDPRLDQIKQALTLADGTVLKALPRLAESFMKHNRDGSAQHGWRLHTQLVLGMPAPHLIQRTSAHNGKNTGREASHFTKNLEAERCYVADRHFHDVSVFNAIHGVGSSYVCRAQENLAYEVLEERPLGKEAKEAGVVLDALVRIGINRAPLQGPSHPVRLVIVQGEPHPKRTRKGTRQSSGKVLLLTSLLDAPPEIIALVYRQRWTVELFFRFLKQVLGLRHLLSQRPEGIDIQVYCCVIACLVISLATGRKANKRMVEMIGWYLIGLASEGDVLSFLNEPDNTGIKLRAKDQLWKKLGV
jgi:hypothetical protein